MGPLNHLTVTEWTESRHWTESTETYEAEQSAQANSASAERAATAARPFHPRHLAAAASPQFRLLAAELGDRDLM